MYFNPAGTFKLISYSHKNYVLSEHLIAIKSHTAIINKVPSKEQKNIT